MTASSTPFSTFVPMANVFSARTLPATGAITATSPPVRGTVSPGTRKLSRKVRSPASCVPKSSAHCCSFVKAMVSSLASAGLSAVAASAAMRTGPTSKFVEILAVHGDTHARFPRSLRLYIRAEDARVAGWVTGEDCGRSIHSEADLTSGVSDRVEITKSREMNVEAASLVGDQGRKLHKQLALTGPPRRPQWLWFFRLRRRLSV